MLAVSATLAALAMGGLSLLVAAPLLALLARTKLDAAAKGLAAGLVAGLLLGATGLGRAAPALYDALAVGARPSQRAVETLKAARAETLDALARTGVSPAAIDEAARDIDAQIAAAQREQARALRARQAGGRALAAMAVVLLLLLTASPTAPLRGRASVADALAGALAAVFPALLFTLVLWKGLGAGAVEAVAACAALAAALPAAAHADDASRRIAAWALRVATLALFAACPTGAAALLLLLTWLAPPLRLSAAQRPLVASAAGVWAMTAALLWVDLQPLLGQRAFWIALLVALLLAGDGRVAGAWMGLRLGGRRTAVWRTGTSLLSGATACAQAALAGLAVSYAPDFAVAALALSAVYVALVAPLAGRFAPLLDALEQPAHMEETPP